MSYNHLKNEATAKPELSHTGIALPLHHETMNRKNFNNFIKGTISLVRLVGKFFKISL
jgi:hypothetical protein